MSPLAKRMVLITLLGGLVGAALGAWRWYGVFTDANMAAVGAFFGFFAGAMLALVYMLLFWRPR